MKKHVRSFLIPTISALTLAFFIFTYITTDNVKETIIYFPLDKNVKFLQTENILSITDKADNDQYKLTWKISSLLNQKVYLHQDIGLLFSNGRLVQTASKWVENNKLLSQQLIIPFKESSHFQAVTYHHGEIHYDDDTIKSTQLMNYNQLYVIDSNPLKSFQKGASPQEKALEHSLKKIESQQLQDSWKRLVRYYDIPLEKYTEIPLTVLPAYNNKDLPGLTTEDTQKAIGQLWEGLYKNYFLGLKKESSKPISPIGSTVPLILLGKDHIIVLIEAKNGEPFQLIQYLK